jgi:hypothetical protein
MSFINFHVAAGIEYPPGPEGESKSAADVTSVTFRSNLNSKVTQAKFVSDFKLH